jgi:hypothetical protein
MSGLPEENLFFLLMRMKAFRTLNYIKTLWYPIGIWMCMAHKWQA